MMKYSLTLGIGVVLFLLIVIFQPVAHHTYGRTIIDDGFYYLGYARNIASGNGPTFDGIVQTNGVQPLWALILSGVAFFFSDRSALLYASLTTAALFGLGSIIQIRHILRNYITSRVYWLILLFYIGFVVNPQFLLSGMESAVNLFVLTTTLRLILDLPKDEIPGRAQLLLIGFWVGLSTLARVDNLIITPTLALLMVWRTGIWHKRQWLQAPINVFWMALPALLMFGTYLIVNHSVFDRWLPISGDIKATHQRLALEATGGRFALENLWDTTLSTFNQFIHIVNTYIWLPLATYGIATLFVRAFLILLLFIGIWYLNSSILRKKIRIRLPRITSSKTIIWLLVILNITLHTWAIHFQLGSSVLGLNWYFVPEFLLLTFGIAWVFDSLNLSERIVRIGTTTLIGLIIFGAGTFLIELWRKPDVAPLYPAYQAALWANDNLPADAIGGSFNAGVIGYFTHMSIINLDGLMNDDGIMQVVLKQDTIWDYVQRQSISYIYDYSFGTWTNTESSFRGMPIEHLDLLFAQDFLNWEMKEATFLIFRRE